MTHKRCKATGQWTVEVPKDFSEIDNGNSWQAHSGSRVVYISSLEVSNLGAPTPAASLCATMSTKLAPPSEGQRVRFEADGRVGEVQIAVSAGGVFGSYDKRAPVVIRRRQGLASSAEASATVRMTMD